MILCMLYADCMCIEALLGCRACLPVRDIETQELALSVNDSSILQFAASSISSVRSDTSHCDYMRMHARPIWPRLGLDFMRCSAKVLQSAKCAFAAALLIAMD